MESLLKRDTFVKIRKKTLFASGMAKNGTNLKQFHISDDDDDTDADADVHDKYAYISNEKSVMIIQVDSLRFKTINCWSTVMKYTYV